MFKQTVLKFKEKRKQDEGRIPNIFDSDFLQEFRQMAHQLFQTQLHGKSVSYRAGVVQKALQMNKKVTLFLEQDLVELLPSLISSPRLPEFTALFYQDDYFSRVELLSRAIETRGMSVALEQVIEKLALLSFLVDSNFQHYINHFNNPLKVMFQGVLGSVPTLEVWRCFKSKETELRTELNSLYKADLSRMQYYHEMCETRKFLPEYSDLVHEFQERKMRREYSFVKHEQDTKAKMKFAVTLLHRQIAQNIYNRQRQGLSQTNVRKLLKEFHQEEYPSRDAREEYERLLIEANTQLKVLALPKVYKEKHKEFTLRVAYLHFKQTYGIEPYDYVRQNWIQQKQEDVSEYAGVVTGQRGHAYPEFGGRARQRRERKNPVTGKIEDHDREETFLRQELTDPEQKQIEEEIEKEVEAQLQNQGFLPSYRETFRPQQTGLTELQRVIKQKREKIVQNTQGELVRMSEMKLLKGAINTSGMLAGLPNYTVIPLQKGTKIDKAELMNEDQLANMTPQKLQELEAQGAQVIHMGEIGDQLNSLALKGEEEDKLMSLMGDLDLDQAMSYMEELTEKYAQMEKKEAREEGLKIPDDEAVLPKTNFGPESRKTVQQQKRERKEEGQLALLDNLRVNRIKRALESGFEINDPVYYEMLQEEPRFLKIKEQRKIRHARREKIADVDQAFQEVPLTRAEEDFLSYEDFLGENAKLMQEYRALERKIVQRWDAEVKEEWEEDELDMEMLGRRFTKQGSEPTGRKKEGKKALKKEEKAALESEIYEVMRRLEK